MIIKLNPRKSNFLETALESVCSNDDLRPAMQCVYFKDGFVYATNAYIAIKQHLSLHNFGEEESRLLDGKLLHKDHLKLMKKCDHFEITSDGIKSTKGMLQMVHQFFDGQFPDLEKVIPEITDFALTKFSINSENLNILQKIMLHESEPFVRIHFSSQNKPFLVSSDIDVNKQVGLISQRVRDHEEK